MKLKSSIQFSLARKSEIITEVAKNLEIISGQNQTIALKSFYLLDAK